MGFGGGFSGSKKSGGGLNVISGSHGQLLRFHSGSASVIGTDDHKVGDDGTLDITGSLKIKGEVRHSGSIASENENDDLGTTDNKYANVNAQDISATNVYTGDLHMKNERGDWTLHEEPDSLVVRNNLTGEKFKLVLEKIEKK
tara:strand:+ start:785 stop:1213 length:429 start_codon:yes stop_codon:yes gene_type:complete